MFSPAASLMGDIFSARVRQVSIDESAARGSSTQKGFKTDSLEIFSTASSGSHA
jgi:hypothetical protein